MLRYIVRRNIFINKLTSTIFNNLSASTYCCGHRPFISLPICCTGKSYLLPATSPSFHPLRLKSKRKKETAREEDSDDENEQDSEDNFAGGKDVQVKQTVVGSMRADLILKVGLGIARNKVEEAFYENKVRVNSKKISKKSAHISVGDEIDLIKGVYSGNTDFLTVSRVEVLSAEPRRDGENIDLKIRRSRSLVIENYPDGHPWKPSDVTLN